MNYVLEGFYKQAEEAGISRVAAQAMLDQINKTAEVLQDYVAQAAIESGDPKGFMSKLAAEIAEAPVQGPLSEEQHNAAFAKGVSAAGQTPAKLGFLEDIAAKYPSIGGLIEKLTSGGMGGAGVGGLGGGAIGLILALLSGKNPLMGLLAGGGIGALGGGLFGDKLKNLGGDSPETLTANQNAAGDAAYNEEAQKQRAAIAGTAQTEAPVAGGDAADAPTEPAPVKVTPIGPAPKPSLTINEPVGKLPDIGSTEGLNLQAPAAPKPTIDPNKPDYLAEAQGRVSKAMSGIGDPSTLKPTVPAGKPHDPIAQPANALAVGGNTPNITPQKPLDPSKGLQIAKP
jgi:hypothetical protein